MVLTTPPSHESSYDSKDRRAEDRGNGWACSCFQIKFKLNCFLCRFIHRDATMSSFGYRFVIHTRL